MRAFIGEFDRVSLGVVLLGAAIGAVWLVALDLGVALAAITLLVGSVALIVRHRWIEIGLLMIGIGLVVQVGYWIFGALQSHRSWSIRTIQPPIRRSSPRCLLRAWLGCSSSAA